VASPAFDGEDHELVQREHGEHEQRLLHERLVAQALVQRHGDVRHERDGERVLREYVPLEYVEPEAREPRREDAAGVGRVDAPVDDDQSDERRTHDRQPVGQRDDLCDQREQYREEHRPAGFAAREIHGFTAGGLAASTASASGVAVAAGWPGRSQTKSTSRSFSMPASGTAWILARG
jgi:hypothetical protein